MTEGMPALRAAFVGDQRNVMPAPLQHMGEREGGREVPAGATRGEHEVTANPW